VGSLARWRRKSPATILLALLLSIAQVQFALAAIMNTVTVTGSFNGTPVIQTADETVDVVNAAPSMVVTKTGILNDDDGTPGISAGDSIGYEILAENSGNISLSGVTANDPMIALSFDPASDLDTDGELDVNETWRWTGTYILLQTDIDTAGGGDNDIDNTATVASDQLVDQIVSEEVPIVPTADVTVNKSGVLNDDDGTPGQSAGDTIDYTVTVRNTGNVTLTITNVIDPLVTLVFDGNDPGSDGMLSPGETWTYTGSYTLLQSDFDTNGGGDGDIDNTVTVSTDQLPDATDSETIPITAGPAIDLVKGADVSGVSGAGDDIIYTVTATNTGNVALTNVTVNDPMLTPDTQICANVLPGATCELIGNYTVNLSDMSAGSVTNTATVTTAEGPTDTEIVTTPLVSTPGLAVNKSASPIVVSSAPAVINYTVTVSNTGNVPLNGVTVTDPLITLDCGGGSSTIAVLNPGSPRICSGSHTVTTTEFDGNTQLVNTVTVADDGTYSVGDTDQATVNFTKTPAMLVIKSGTLNDDDGTAGITDGDTIGYQVSVRNTGNVSLTNVSASDPMAALTYASGDTDSDNEIDPGETWIYTGAYTLTQGDIDSNGGGDGQIENTATVSSDQLPDRDASTSVPLNLAPSLDVVKNGVLNDDDGNPGLTAGDTVNYTVTLTNTGNIALTNPGVSDPLVALTYQSGDTNSDGNIDTDEAWIYGGTTIITQGDLDTLGGGDGDIDNTATATTDQLPPIDVSHELPIAPISTLEIKKQATVPVQLFPTVFEFDYQIVVRNTGAITQTGIRLEDDIAAAIAPATLVTSPSVVVSGFSGSGGFNAGYDGVTDRDLLTGDVQLPPGAIATITITVRIDTGANTVSGLNTAIAVSDQILTPISSDDPTETPGDPSDTNPTPVTIPDTDSDGSPDGVETPGGDRDGDGIADPVDYDPTGYFYCEANGRILTGGLITVENLTAGGSQIGLGSSNGVTILRDGSDGRYQFHATQPGTFRLTYILPGSGVASTATTTSGTLDVSTRLPDNPVVIGSGEFGSSGLLADFTPASNPFFTQFQIEAGDPAVFNNNIPLQYCGSPIISADKSVESGPDLQPDLSHRVTYRLALEATGDEQVNSVQMVDDLAAVFGAGNFTINSVTLDSAPAGFTGAIDPFYDGDGNTALLTAGGMLQPGERVEILLELTLNVVDGVYSNTLVGNGASPLDGSPVTPSLDDAEITITNPTDELVVEKTATPGSAPIGAPVSYTITVSNIGVVDATGVDIIDLIPNGMTYVPGSATLAGVASEPEIRGAVRLKEAHKSLLDKHDNADPSGRELVWPNVTIVAGGSMTVTLVLVIDASAAADVFTNLAFIRDPSTGETTSNIARARVRLEIEPVFQCSDLIGRVFDDKDRDGYHDDGEPGLPGVRLATARGLLVTTDEFGRYHIACGAIPDEDIGSNFIMKLDERSLPSGYRVTTENPRVVRLTRGKLTKLNFGAASLRIVDLKLTGQSFTGDGLRLSGPTLQSLGSLLRLLDEEPSILRIEYDDPNTTNDLAKARLEAAEQLLRRAWVARSRTNSLEIESRVSTR
jgi:uncharacterized repeat protein (TIGR01451 family)